MSIHLLPSEVVDQIAAGEVVERPAHMVKELVENALDAGATLIEVEFDQGGRRVRVTDNGSGIDPDDLPRALARHATSKISTAADLWQLSSFGFRGEALASIAAVSRLGLTSKRVKRETERDMAEPDERAYQLLSEFGRVGSVEPAGGNPGTSVLIEELFSNVPARLKFLKSESAESAQIKTTLKALALVHPQVEFRLKSQGKLVQIWPKAQGLRERVEQVLETKPMFENTFAYSGLQAHAIFASPHQVTGNARQIWLFVQDRWVQDRGLQAAVNDAYRGLLMHGEYPIVCVRLTCPPDEIDVNIHPTKSAVKFRDAQAAFRVVQRCLREGLERAPWLTKQKPETSGASVQTPQAAYVEPASTIRQPMAFDAPEFRRTQYQKHEPTSLDRGPGAAPVTFDVLRAAANASPEYLGAVEAKSAPQIRPEPVAEAFVRPAAPQAREAAQAQTRFWSRMQVLGQAHLTYILAESDDILYLIDQHAAHERIAYERLMRAWRDGQTTHQELLLPLTIQLDSDAVEAIVREAPDLARLGIDLEQMGPDAVALRAVPVGIKEQALVESLSELAREIVEKGGGFAIERKISDLCATMACHSVVRAGQVLSFEQMRQLLEQMDEFPLSSFCPHGRPVSVEYPFTKLERDFGRRV